MKNDYLSEMADVYTRAAIGDHVHSPVNMIFQCVDATHAAGVFQFQASPELIKRLTCGANLHNNHVLWIGDAFFRPQIVTQSKHLMGNGIASIYTTGFIDVDEWIEHGKMLKGEIPAKMVRQYAPF